jgi:allantoicase
MGEGWETQRRRDGGHDHVLFRLAFRGSVRRIIIDTAHFRYNASAEVALYGSAQEPHGSAQDPRGSAQGLVPPGAPQAWPPLLARTRLQPDTRHEFASQYADPVSLVRLDAFPDGGLSRVRLIGLIEPKARRAVGYRWFNSLPAAQAVQCLLATGLEPDLAIDLAAQRPLTEGTLRDPPDALLTMIEGRSAQPC